MREVLPSLSMWLRGSTLRQFHDFLFPAENAHAEANCPYVLAGTIFQIPKVRRTDLHDQHELFDQLRRAKAVANAIKNKMIKGEKTHLYLLDGHGRMLLCILHELIALQSAEKEKIAIDLLDEEKLIIHVVDLDDDVDAFHRLVFPKCVKFHFGNIITNKKNAELYPEKGSVVYLNFCSVPSAGEAFKNYPKSGMYFCRETIIRYIHEISIFRECKVFVSFVVRGSAAKFRTETTYDGLTGQGFCNFLLKHFLQTKVVSIRPAKGLDWKVDTRSVVSTFKMPKRACVRSYHRKENQMIESINMQLESRKKENLERLEKKLGSLDKEELKDLNKELLGNLDRELQRGDIRVEAKSPYSFVTFELSDTSYNEDSAATASPKSLKNVVSSLLNMTVSSLDYAQMQPGDEAKVKDTPKREGKGKRSLTPYSNRRVTVKSRSREEVMVQSDEGKDIRTRHTNLEPIAIRLWNKFDEAKIDEAKT
mmetsp:Transcript_38305/g.64213  ORF Transcript_38305/g.64213 Transcript_38305/m.64213 type:complete len:479 (+) Transcript_38305:400-1836(+)